MPLRPGSGRKKAAVNKLFTDIPSKGGKLDRVKCTFCSYELSKGGSRMTKHINICKKCPNSVRDKYITSSSEEVKNRQELCLSQPSVSSSLRSPVTLYDVNTSTERQSQLKTFIDRINTADQVKANELLARAIYASNSSLRIVENPFWIEYLSFLRPAYKVPTRHEVSSPLLNTEYERVASSVSEKIAAADTVSLMCDGWTNIRNEPVVNFVATTPSPVLYKILPTGKASHTAQYIAQEIGLVIQEIGAQKVFGIVTDNAANMKAAWEILKNENHSTNLFTYGCVAHTLNLLFTDLKNLKTLQTFLAEAVSAIKAIKHTHRLTEIFKEKQGQQRQHHNNPVALKLPVQTRWGSIVHCLDSLDQNKQAMKILAVEEEAQEILKKHPVIKKIALDETFWDKVKGFLQLLKPIATAITSVESDKPKISQVVSVFRKLELHFEETLPQSPLSKAEEGEVKKIFAKRKDFGVCEVHRAANLLDPLARGVDLTPDEQVSFYFIYA